MKRRSEHKTVNARSRMSLAYREMFSPGVLVLVAATLGAVVWFVATLGPYGTDTALDLHQRVLACVLWGILVGSAYYGAGLLIIYLMRFLSRVRIAMGLTVYAVLTPALCAPIPFLILDHLFGHDAWTPRLAVKEYLTSVPVLAAATALLYSIVCLRVTRAELLNAAEGAAEEGADTSYAGRRASHERSYGSGGVNGAVAHGAAAGGGTGAPEGEVRTATAATLPDGDDARPTTAASTARSAPASGAEFFKHVPSELGRDLVYVKVSGHYLEVVTTRGRRVIIRSLADAVRELDGRGMRTHRSYWVAYAHIRCLVRRDRRFVLRLDAGDHEIPVSRTFLADVQHHVRSSRVGAAPTSGG